MVFFIFCCCWTCLIYFSFGTIRYILWILSKSNWFISISEQWISLSNLSFLSINETHPCCMSSLVSVKGTVDLQISHMLRCWNFSYPFSLFFNNLEVHSVLLNRGNLAGQRMLERKKITFLSFKVWQTKFERFLEVKKIAGRPTFKVQALLFELRVGKIASSTF